MSGQRQRRGGCCREVQRREADAEQDHTGGATRIEQTPEVQFRNVVNPKNILVRLFAVLLVVFLLSHDAEGISSEEYLAVEIHLNETANEALKNLVELLKIPSVSADPLRAAQVREAGVWLRDHLADSGLENARLLETDGHPSVYADWLHAPDAPTVLIYAHYDVQPEDPLDLWTTPPFQPTVRDGRLYARGASDDKGQMYVPITVIRAYLKVLGKLPVNIKLLLEGEEEIGSPNLVELLRKHKELFKADYAFSADGGQISETIPGICLALRGSVALEVKLVVGNADMHSGMYGGGVQNPIHALSALLATMRDINTGRILIEGFYDDVDEITSEERADTADFPVESDIFLKRNGVNETVGEKGFSFLERVWSRPSLDVVGITGGFQGDGIKTVLPREASAKISARIVSSQKPKQVMNAIRGHLFREAAKIRGISIELPSFPFVADPYKMEKNTNGNRAATKVLTDVYGMRPAFFKLGGSIPALTYLQRMLGLETTMFAFALDDNAVHAPNEFARLSGFRKGEIAYVRLFRELAEASSAKDEL